MNNYEYNPYFDVYSNYLAHHGVQGMKWGVRRYQPYPNGVPKGSKEVGQATKVKQRNEGEAPSKGSIFTYGQRKRNLVKQLKKEHKGEGTRKEVKRFAEDEAERQLKDQYGLKKAEKAEKIGKIGNKINKVKNTVVIGRAALAVTLAGVGAVAAKKTGLMNNEQIKATINRRLARAGLTTAKYFGAAAATDIAVNQGLKLAVKAEDKRYAKKQSQNKSVK